MAAAAAAMLNVCREVESKKSRRAPNPVRGGGGGVSADKIGRGGVGVGMLSGTTTGVPHDGVRWK